MLESIHNLSTVNLFYEYKIINKNGIVKENKKDISRSFLSNFAKCLFGALFKEYFSDVIDVNGNTFTLRINTTNSWTFDAIKSAGNIDIYFSASADDGTLSFNDYKLNNILGDLTRIVGYPQYVKETGSDFFQYRITEKYLYAGTDTNIYASALYYRSVIDTGGGQRQVMFIKDIYNPAIVLPSNHIIEFSYIIRIQL